MANVNPETRAVDEQVHRALAWDRRNVDYPQVLEPPGQRRVVGDREVHLKQASKGTQEALGLSKRKGKDHADRQSRLDGDVRVGRLAARFPAGQSSPGVQCSVGKPDCKVASSL